MFVDLRVKRGLYMRLGCAEEGSRNDEMDLFKVFEQSVQVQVVESQATAGVVPAL